MKKISLIIVFGLFAFVQINAQVTFKPGLRAGANFSHFTQGDDYDDDIYYEVYDPTFVGSPSADFNNKTDFYIGFYGALRLTKYYTLQPEINYSRQGSEIEYRYNNARTQIDFDVSYLSIGIINKFTFSEKFNVHIGPTIDFVVDKSRSVSAPAANFVDGVPYYYEPYTDLDPTDVDLAFVAGLGFNFTKNIGIEARIKKGIIPVIDFYDSDHTNVVYSIGATYTFDLK